MIYNLPESESFVDFIEYNRLKDLGFNEKGLKIEACTVFAFLTNDKIFQRLFINILLVDPYYDQTQICLYKSKKCFIFKSPETRDIVLKSVMY